ncbi:MAG: hypothetical protein FWE22_05385 [Firmicutes bacterium]|nr:hypothetical protein [Bacillota bacterium]
MFEERMKCECRLCLFNSDGECQVTTDIDENGCCETRLLIKIPNDTIEKMKQEAFDNFMSALNYCD